MELLFTTYGVLALLVGYLLGSIPFGLLLTRAAGLGDVRNIGSGSIGATNVLRTGRKGLAAATLLLDALKGFLAAILVYEVAKRALAFDASQHQLSYIAALGAVLGHMFSVWLGFTGGKSVATYIGALFGLHLPAAVVFCVVWAAVAGIGRYSSLASLTATLAVVLYYLLLGQAGLPFVLVMSALIIAKHHSNIRRLLVGEESKIGARSTART